MYNANILTPLTKKLSVLVIESEYKISENFFDYLTDFFKSVTFEYDEKLIFSHFKSSCPDILIADLDTRNINIFQMIEKMRKVNPRLQIIIFSDKENSEIFLKCIKYKVSAFLKKSCGLTQLKNEIKNITNELCITNEDFFSLNDREYEDSNLEVITALEYLLKNKNQNLSLVNHYKGVPIIKNTTLTCIDDNKIHVLIDDLNKYTLKHLKHAVFTSIHLNKEIYADLVSLNKETNIAIFENLSFINSYIHYRKFPRVEPCENLSVILEVNNKHHKLEIKDFSLNYVLFLTDELPNNFKINNEVKIHINLTKSLSNIPTYEKHSFTCKAQINEIFMVEDKFKILVYFDLENDLKNVLKIYINKRSTDLIKEFKSICQTQK